MGLEQELGDIKPEARAPLVSERGVDRHNMEGKQKRVRDANGLSDYWLRRSGRNISKKGSFSDFRKLKNLTFSEIRQLSGHCYRGHMMVDDHFLFHGKDGEGYSFTTFTFRGIHYNCPRHFLALALKIIGEGLGLE